MNLKNNFALATTCLQKHGWWLRLREKFFEYCFALPVVYTDGLISRCKKYQNGRTPFGIMVENMIVLLCIPDEAQTFIAAEYYCRDIWFAGRRAVIGNLRQMRKINKHFNELEDVYFDLMHGSLPRKRYWTQDVAQLRREAWKRWCPQDFTAPLERQTLMLNGESTSDILPQKPYMNFYVMPLVDLEDPKTLLRAL